MTPYSNIMLVFFPSTSRPPKAGFCLAQSSEFKICGFPFLSLKTPKWLPPVSKHYFGLVSLSFTHPKTKFCFTQPKVPKTMNVSLRFTFPKTWFVACTRFIFVPVLSLNPSSFALCTPFLQAPFLFLVQICGDYYCKRFGVWYKFRDFL